MSTRRDLRMIKLANKKFRAGIKKWTEFDDWLLGTIRPLYKTDKEYKEFTERLERESVRVYLGGE